jgi:hypothetical protein
VPKVFAMYNNNDDLLTMENASFAYLFGVDGPTDTMNSLAGPVLTKVGGRAGGRAGGWGMCVKRWAGRSKADTIIIVRRGKAQ